MKKGSIVTVRDFIIHPNYHPDDLFVIINTPDVDGDVKVVNIELGEFRYAKFEGLKKVKGEVPFTVASKRAFGYKFVAAQRGKRLILSAGCRTFSSVKEAREHWSNGPKGYHYEYKDDYDWWEDRKEENKTHLAAMLEVYQEMKEKL